MTQLGSVTRLYEISSFWNFFKSLWAILGLAYVVIGKLLYQLWHFKAKSQIVIVVNGQRLKSNSHLVTLQFGYHDDQVYQKLNKSLEHFCRRI